MTVLGIGLLTLTARQASAQAAPVGVRAAGMGGAFTAVADDATATYWNPAGLATGPFVGASIDANVLDRQSGQFAGLVLPPLGISYFRTATSTGAPPNDRNGALVDVTVHHVEATVDQSIGDTGLTVGGSFGLVHGNGASAFGADAGVMLAGGLGKIGLAVHNLTEPSLGGVKLERQVRAGVSLHLHAAMTLAADVDLATTTSDGEPVREAALGVEVHPLERTWVRGGMHWNTAGTAAAPIGTVGASVAVYGAIRVDGQASFGSSRGDRGWGVGLSFIY